MSTVSREMQVPTSVREGFGGKSAQHGWKRRFGTFQEKNVKMSFLKIFGLTQPRAAIRWPELLVTLCLYYTQRQSTPSCYTSFFRKSFGDAKCRVKC
jgi:hypothetical protein